MKRSSLDFWFGVAIHNVLVFSGISSMRNRGRLEMYVEVLRAIKKGAYKPTNVMYKANLSWGPMNKILDSLTSQGLITVQQAGRHKVYEITGKGKNVLQYFSKAEAILMRTS